MDQKAKDNSGSGLSWYLGRGLAISSLRLFRGFQGRVVWWIWDLENQFYSHRDYCGDFLSALFLFFFCTPDVVDKKISRVQGSTVGGSGEISADQFSLHMTQVFFFSSFGYVKFRANLCSMDGIPHLRYSGEICITLATWRISLGGMYASIFRCFLASPPFLNNNIFIISNTTCFSGMTNRCWIPNYYPNISISQGPLILCQFPLVSKFVIRYLLYGMPIQNVQVKSSIGRPMYVKRYFKDVFDSLLSFYSDLEVIGICWNRITDRPHNIYIRAHQEMPEQVINFGPISLPRTNETSTEGRHLFRLVQQYLCLSVIFVSRWRIWNMKLHVSCKPDGWIPIGVSRIYILILRWVSLATRLQITYLFFGIYVNFSGCTEQSRGEYRHRGARGRKGGGDGETSHKKWLDLWISLLDWLNWRLHGLTP